MVGFNDGADDISVGDEFVFIAVGPSVKPGMGLLVGGAVGL